MNQTSHFVLRDLGYNYQNGINVNKDEKKAFELYLKAANMGYSTAMFDVGYCYEKGIGVEKDEHKAFIYYQKSADMGDANGTYNVGYCYSNGIGVEKDEHKAFICYQKSADMGDANAICSLGYCYKNGIGVETDDHKAFFYFQKSADMGDANGAYNAGFCYEKEIGVEKDEHKAFIYYQKSADMGYVGGTCGVGYCYKNGIGVEKDGHKAFFYFQKSADMGDEIGMNNLGNLYEFGIGVEKDEHKAFIYYQKSAEMGHINGMTAVARCYRNGVGVERDIQNANYWYRRANKSVTVIYECASKKIDFDYDLRKVLNENNYLLPWIPYDEFQDIIEIGKGGFATVCRAFWHDKSRYYNSYVALKMLNLNNQLEFIKELKVFCGIGDVYPSFLKCYGITKNANGEYTFVLEYAEKQSLSKNLYDVARMTWKNKVKLLQCIISDIDMIHLQGYIHRDLHSGNILQQDIDNAYVVDLGFASSIKSEIEGIYGVLPYVAPEVLTRQSSFTQASDIYSFGIIMIEISVGQRPFDGVPFDKTLAMRICLGLRPEFALGTPNCYVELAKQCMDPDPQKRPTASVITDKLNKWYDSICVPSTVQDIEVGTIKQQFIEADKMINELPTVEQKHSDQIYTSKLINTREITENLSKIVIGSKSLDCVEIP